VSATGAVLVGLLGRGYDEAANMNHLPSHCVSPAADPSRGRQPLCQQIRPTSPSDGSLGEALVRLSRISAADDDDAVEDAREAVK